MLVLSVGCCSKVGEELLNFLYCLSEDWVEVSEVGMGVMFVLAELVMELSTDIFRVVGDCRFGLMMWFRGLCLVRLCLRLLSGVPVVGCGEVWGEVLHFL